MRLLALIFPCHQSWNLFIISLLLFAKNGKFEPSNVIQLLNVQKYVFLKHSYWKHEADFA